MTIDPQLLFTGALIAASGTLIYQLKSIPSLIYNKIRQRLIYRVTIYQYDPLFDMLESWLSDHHKNLYRDVEAGLFTYEKLTYKQEENTFILNYQGKKILINKGKEKLDKAQSLKDIWFRRYSLTGIRAKSKIDSLLTEVIESERQKEDKSSVRIYANNQYGSWEFVGKKKVKSLEKTVINPENKEFIKRDIDELVESEQWYIDTSIPYKRGYCFFGPPGTGKTTMALAIANYTKRSVYSLNLNCLDDDSRIPGLFSNMNDNGVLLIEDIDKVFSGRDNVRKECKVSFSALLNCLDGVFYKHGLIVIITTNHIEKLDEALLRTGRIDVKMQVPLPTYMEISEYLTLFYQRPIEISGSFELKMSDIQDICLSNKNNPNQAIKQIKNYNNANKEESNKISQPHYN